MGKGKLILICQSGGKFVTDDDGTMTYTGGEAEAIDINHETSFHDFKLKLAKLWNLDFDSLSLKYFLPGNRTTLITMRQEKDMKRMYDFHLSSVSAEVFVTGQEGFHSQAPANWSDNIAVRADTTLIAYGNVANVPIEVATEDNSLVDVSLISRKVVAPGFTSESSGLVEIPVTVSTGPVVPAKSTSKKPKRKGKTTSLASSNYKLTPRSSKQTVMGSKSSSPMSPASVSKRRRVMEEPSMLLQDENAGETRRRSLRNRGEIRKP